MLGICHNASRTICSESQVYALLWLHGSCPNIFNYINIYTNRHTHTDIEKLSLNSARPLQEYEKNKINCKSALQISNLLQYINIRVILCF